MTNPAPKLLLVDDDAPFRMAVRKVLSRKGYKVDEAKDGVDASHLLDTKQYHVVIIDLRMPRLGGLAVLKRHVQKGPRFILLTGYGTIETAVEAMALGATSFLQKPFENDHLLSLVENCIQEAKLKGQKTPPGQLIGESSVMRQVKERLARVAPTDETIYLMGETGTGKELAAQSIHRASPRAGKAFVPLNCACVNKDEFESKLFGHERGAFLGALDSRLGLLREADGGTLFIDELGELSLDCQAKLLRVLETNCLRPVGATSEVRVNVRVITATNRDLLAEVHAGRFREDLYFRLQVVPILLPPLRERVDDIPRLARHLIPRIMMGRTASPPSLSLEAITLLQAYNWPGNVRELMNILKRAILFSDDTILGAPLIQDMVEGSIFCAKEASESRLEPKMQTVPLKPRSLGEVEREHITRLFEEMGGNVSQLARILRIDRRTLQRKLRAYGYPPQ